MLQAVLTLAMCMLAEMIEHRLRRIAERRGIESSFGSAITLAYILWPDLYVVHVGDSRCYLFRDGRLYRIAVDTSSQEATRQVGGTDDITAVVCQCA